MYIHVFSEFFKKFLVGLHGFVPKRGLHSICSLLHGVCTGFFQVEDLNFRETFYIKQAMCIIHAYISNHNIKLF
jgi:hypothetical protein